MHLLLLADDAVPMQSNRAFYGLENVQIDSMKPSRS